MVLNFLRPGQPSIKGTFPSPSLGTASGAFPCLSGPASHASHGRRPGAQQKAALVDPWGVTVMAAREMAGEIGDSEVEADPDDGLELAQLLDLALHIQAFMKLFDELEKERDGAVGKIGGGR